jgi:hemolysin activation/secretion protein
VKVEEANQLTGSVSFDNYSPVSVGSERMGTSLNYRNLTGSGDSLAASYYRSTTGGSNLYDFNYTIPVNPMNGTIAFRYAPNNYRITDPAFADLNIRGASSLYDIALLDFSVRPMSLPQMLVSLAGQDRLNGCKFSAPMPFSLRP